MKCRFGAPAALLLALHCVSAVRLAEEDDKAKDEASIRALASAFEKTHNEHDPKTFAALFAPDGDFTNGRGMTARGWQAIEEFHQPLFEGDPSKGNPSFKNAVLKIDAIEINFIRPDVASADIHWTQTGSVAPDGKDRGTRKGPASWVVSKEDGNWQVAVMHNMDLLPTSPQAEPKKQRVGCSVTARRRSIPGGRSCCSRRRSAAGETCASPLALDAVGETTHE